MADWVLAVERAYVDVATHRSAATDAPSGELLSRARAAVGAVASRFLAVGTPRSFGLVVDGATSAADAALSLEAHRTWFAPADIRCTGTGADALAASVDGRAVTLAEALASDIVCVHAPLSVPDGSLRRGTHVNVLVGGAVLPDDLARLAVTTHEVPGLGELAAGLVDGRQLDELTVFILGDARTALAALAALP